jgi:hypothetical protein
MCDLQLDFICTYKMITEDDEDEKGLSDLMYKIQYLQLFGLTEYDETMINEKLATVYKQLEKEPFLDELFEFHTYKGYMTKEFMFRTMFSYEYFDLFHRLLYNYYHKLSIANNVRQLKDQLKLYMDERLRENPSNIEK